MHVLSSAQSYSDLVEERSNGIVTAIQDEQKGRHLCLPEVKKLILLSDDLLKDTNDTAVSVIGLFIIAQCHWLICYWPTPLVRMLLVDVIGSHDYSFNCHSDQQHLKPCSD